MQTDAVQRVEVENSAYLHVSKQCLLLHVQFEVALGLALLVEVVFMFADPHVRKVQVVHFNVEDLVHAYLTENANTLGC